MLVLYPHPQKKTLLELIIPDPLHSGQCDPINQKWTWTWYKTKLVSCWVGSGKTIVSLRADETFVFSINILDSLWRMSSTQGAIEPPWRIQKRSEERNSIEHLLWGWWSEAHDFERVRGSEGTPPPTRMPRQGWGVCLSQMEPISLKCLWSL